MLTKLAIRQAIRQLKANIFHLMSLIIIFMVTFVMATFSFDESVTKDITSAFSSDVLDAIGGVSTIFRVFLVAIIIVNIFFLSYIFRLRMRQNAKTYALYRLLGLRSYDLFVIYTFEVIVLTVVTAVIGGICGIGAVQGSQTFLVSLGTVAEPSTKLSFSMFSYLMTVAFFAVSMLVATLLSFVIIVRTDIIVLFKRDQLVQKVSKLTPVYFVLSVVMFLLLPQFAKIGDGQSEFLRNALISMILSVVGMYFLFKSAISIIFGVRKYLNLHKRHGSEFITGQFFFSQLNKSALMMTIVSFFLIIVFLFSFLTESLVGEKDFDEKYMSDFSMMNPTQEDKTAVIDWLKKNDIQVETTDMEYLHVMTNPNTNNTLMNASEIEQALVESKTNETLSGDLLSSKYHSSFYITENTYQNLQKQFEKVNRTIPAAIKKYYNEASGKEVKQITGFALSAQELEALGLSPEMVGMIPDVQTLSEEEVRQTLTSFMDMPALGAGIVTFTTSNPVHVVSQAQFEQLQNKGRIVKQTTFNAPGLKAVKYRKMMEETVLNKYLGQTTSGKMHILLVNVESQAPIRFSLAIMFIQVMFYIILLILYRLSEMLQKQYRIFDTLHIVGASNTTIFGSIGLQIITTLIFPVVVSCYIAWIAVYNVFSNFYTNEEIWKYFTGNLPIIFAIFGCLAIAMTFYQSLTVRRRQIKE